MAPGPSIFGVEQRLVRTLAYPAPWSCKRIPARRCHSNSGKKAKHQRPAMSWTSVTFSTTYNTRCGFSSQTALWQATACIGPKYFIRQQLLDGNSRLYIEYVVKPMASCMPVSQCSTVPLEMRETSGVCPVSPKYEGGMQKASDCEVLKKKH